MARKDKAPDHKKRWWETLGGLAGAILAVAAVVGGAVQLVSPRQSVTLTVVDGSWAALGRDTNLKRDRWALTDANKNIWTAIKPEPSRFRYAFDVQIKNTGNRSVKMAEVERKLVYVSTSEPRRPYECPPTIELIKHEAIGNVNVNSKHNNAMQINIRNLSILERSIVHVEVLSPISDLGSVFLVSQDPLLVVANAPVDNGDPKTRTNLLSETESECLLDKAAGGK